MYDEDLIQTLCVAKKLKLKDSALTDNRHEVATASQDPGQASFVKQEVPVLTVLTCCRKYEINQAINQSVVYLIRLLTETQDYLKYARWLNRLSNQV